MFSKQHRTILGTLTTCISKAKKPWYIKISTSLVYAPKYASEQQQRPEISLSWPVGQQQLPPREGVSLFCCVSSTMDPALLIKLAYWVWVLPLWAKDGAVSLLPGTPREM